MFERIAELALDVSGYRLERRALATSGGWVRETTVVRLHGGDETGLGEDVCYEVEDHVAFRERTTALPLAGRWTIQEFSEHLGALDLFPIPPKSPSSRSYRRWAFESAALDLALRQAGRSLGGALGRDPAPVEFVASLGLGEPPRLDAIDAILERVPRLRFKVDFGAAWTERTIDALAVLGDAIAVVDLKGQYRGLFRGPAADAHRYRLVAERLPHAWLEDPEWNVATAEALDAHRDRVTWDAILHDVDDIESLPFPPRCINVKPSRFGTVRELLAVYAHCERRGIRMYGGGQFELGPGRPQIQRLASLFHPDAPNDTAPGEFNSAELPPSLPASPLLVPRAAPGFR